MSCEYCKDKRFFDLNPYDGFYLQIDEYGLSVWEGDKCLSVGKVNYCPHCGRLLNNRPLTLDELKEMEGEPVWIVELENNDSYYAIIGKIDHQSIVLYDIHCNRYGLDSGALKLYGKTWIAYRQKVEE